jgi:hypothetical protein
VSGTAIPLTAQGISRGAIDDADAEAVIKPKPLQAPVEGGFTVDDVTVDDFTVDEQAGHGGLPGRSHPPDQPDPGGRLRCTVPWVSSAGAVHHIRDRS